MITKIILAAFISKVSFELPILAWYCFIIGFVLVGMYIGAKYVKKGEVFNPHSKCRHCLNDKCQAILITECKYVPRYVTIDEKYNNLPLTRKNLYTKYDGRCTDCKTKITPEESVMSHIVKPANGGATT